MSITLAASPLWLIACVLVAAGAAVYSYRQTPSRVPRAIQYLLGSLRGIAIFLILTLLLQPVILQSETTEERQVVPVLLDSSRSIPYIADDGDLEQQLLESFDLLRQLENEADLQLYTFDEHLVSQGALPRDEASLSFDGHHTNLGGALQQVARATQDQRVGGMVVLTDGQPNRGPDARQVASRSLVPIHTVALGDTTRPRYIQVDRIQTNERAIVNRETPIRVYARANGLEGETVQARLLHEGTELDAAEFSAPADGATTPVDLSFTPAEVGTFSYQINLEPPAGQTEQDIVSDVFSLRTIDEGRLAMLVTGGPSPAVASLRRIAEREVDLSIVSHIEQPDGSFYEGAITTPADSVDLLLISGFPTAHSSPEAVAQINDFLEAEVPVFFQLSAGVDVLSLNDFAGHLPFQIEGDFTDWQESGLRPGADARQHPSFSHVSPDGGWELLPPLQYPAAGWSFRADARSLLESSDRQPVVGTREFSDRRSSAIMAPNAWQWSNLPPSLDPQRHLWRSFLRDLIQWTLADPADQRVVVTPSRPDFHETEAVTFDAEVNDAQGRPIEQATITVTAYGPENEAYSTTLQREGGALFEGDLGELSPGSYDFEAVAEVDGSELGDDRGSFTVGAHDPEEAFTFADGELLSEIADRSRGSFSLLDNLNELPGMLQSQLHEAPAEREIVQERLFWQWPLVLAVVLGLFTVEWVIRKRRGLP